MTDGGASSDRERVESMGTVEEMVGKGKKVHAVASAVSVKPSLNEALADVAAKCFGRLKAQGCTEVPDLALIFVSARYSIGGTGPYGRESLDTVVRSLKSFLPGIGVIAGGTADGVVGEGVEDPQVVFDKGSVSLMLAHLPGVDIRPFHIVPDDIPGLDAGQEVWRKLVGGFPFDQEGTPSFITLSDPTFAAHGNLESFLEGVDFAYPRCSVVGALTSAAVGSGKGNLFLTLPRDVLDPSSSSLRDCGMIGVAMRGDIEVDCLVAQSCRSVGPIYEVDKVRRSRVSSAIMTMKQQGFKSTPHGAKSHLDSIIKYATPAESKAIESNLQVRVARDVFKQKLGDDDFLVRDVLGIDADSGGITVCFDVKEGDRVQFCVKDSGFAIDQFRKALQKYKRAALAESLIGYSNPPFGALLFGDSGGIFRTQGLESRELASFTGGVPIGGFFSWGGQIGPAKSMSKKDEAPNDTRSFNHSGAGIVAFLRKRNALAVKADESESKGSEPDNQS